VVFCVFLLDFGTVFFGFFLLDFGTVSVGTVPKSNQKTKNITPSEQFQNLIKKQKIRRCGIFVF
jgi:flavin-dependent dehydrogenase